MTHPIRTRAWFLPLGLLILSAGMLPDSARAQEYGIPPTVLRRAPLPDHAKLMLTEINRPAVVTLLNGAIMRGLVGDVTATEFVLLMDQSSLAGLRLALPWAQISTVRVDRRPKILQGLLVGGVGGALVGALTPLGEDVDRKYLGVEAPRQVWNTAAQGAAIGALLGLLSGWDVLLPYQAQSYGIGSIRAPGQRPIRPSMRLITTSPTQSLTYDAIDESLLDHVPYPTPRSLTADDSWNGRTGAALALETSWPWDNNWWVRSRLEWFTLPRLSRTSVSTLDASQEERWREYGATRAYVGFVRTFGGVGRLPFAELAILAGVSHTTLRSGISYEGTGPPDPFRVDRTQKVWRPLLMGSGSIALVRRPTLAVALRAEGYVGPGFTANALIHQSVEYFSRRRITAIGLSVGLEVLFPRF